MWRTWSYDKKADEQLWWKKFSEEANKIVWEDWHYFKEKYWRFDTTYYWGRPWVQDILYELELESEETCQRCAKRWRQFRTDWWWIEHWCWKCYLILLIKRWWYRFKKHINK